MILKQFLLLEVADQYNSIETSQGIVLGIRDNKSRMPTLVCLYSAHSRYTPFISVLFLDTSVNEKSGLDQWFSTKGSLGGFWFRLFTCLFFLHRSSERCLLISGCHKLIEGATGI